MPLSKKTIHVPIAAGVNTKDDERSLAFPHLAVLENGRFAEVGGIQKAHGYSAMSLNIAGGGTLSDVRKLATFKKELLAFTKDKLYSYSPAFANWEQKAEYFAVAHDEEPVHVSEYEQTEADRAELGGLIFTVWRRKDLGSSADVFIQVRDKSSGAVIHTALEMTADRPRVFACQNRIVILFRRPETSSILYGYSIDPTDSTFAAINGSPTNIATLDVSGYYDVVPIAGTTAFMLAYRNSSGQYNLARWEESLTNTFDVAKARSCSGPLAVSVAPNGVTMVVRWDSATNRLNADNMDGSTGVDISVNSFVDFLSQFPEHITAAHKVTTDGGYYRGYIFVSSGETATGGTSFSTRFYWCDTGGGTPGVPITHVINVGVASRAFEYDGHVWAHLVFSGGTLQPSGATVELQNTYFLYRSDGFIAGRMVAYMAGGFPTIGWLPGVANVGGSKYAWCGTQKRAVTPEGRLIDIDSGERSVGYSGEFPVDIVLEFDSARARRTVEVGEALYISGSLGLLYDGVELVETNAFLIPWHVTSANTSTPATSLEALKQYSYKVYFERTTKRGERVRSTTALVVNHTTSATPHEVRLTVVPLQVSTLMGGNWVDWSIVVYRTEADPGPGAPYYRASNPDPFYTSGDNSYLFNEPDLSSLTWDDDLSDTSLVERELDYQNQDASGLTELDNLPFPRSSIITEGQNRIFWANDDDLNTVRYSKLHFEGDVVAYNDALEMVVPQEGGKITGIIPLDNPLIIFKEHRIFQVAGSGPDNKGSGAYAEPQIISGDTGCNNPDSLVRTPEGIMFQSPKGIYLLDRGLNLRYIGAPVEDFTKTQTVIAAVLAEDRHEVFFLCDTGSALVYDYAVGQWSVYPNVNGVSAVLWQGAIVHATASAIFKEDPSTYTRNGSGYSLVWETPWMPIGEVLGFGRCYSFLLHGKKKGAHALRARIAYDYEESGGSPVWRDDKEWTVDDSGRQGYLCRVQPSIQKISAVKIRVEDVIGGGNNNSPTNEAYQITGITFDIGVKGRAARPQAGKAM